MMTIGGTFLGVTRQARSVVASLRRLEAEARDTVNLASVEMQGIRVGE
jgi:hypothetical protein